MTSWTPEFCTVCDKQCILGNVYCSEQCRELDMQNKREGTSDAASALSTAYSSHESSESSEDDEVPMLSLSKQISNQSQHGTARSAPRPKKKEFLYASPVLKPSKGPSISPNVSPLLMPRASPEPSEQISAQSVSTYKRWLAGGRK